jgi:hypothetical protein
MQESSAAAIAWSVKIHHMVIILYIKLGNWL